MTNEEIERAAADLYLDSVCRDDFRPEDLAEVRSDISAAMRALVSQAYEEAAATLCRVCAKGERPEFEGGLWMHEYAPICPAGNIHDLIAQLESVPA